LKFLKCFQFEILYLSGWHWHWKWRRW